MTPEKEQILFTKYPKIFKQPDTPKESLMFFGFECKDGWFWLIDNLCQLIQGITDANPNRFLQVEATQVKEKFGSLRFYYNGGNDKIDGMVSFAEYLSEKICEKCGSQEQVSQTTGGWIQTLCQNCLDKKS